MQYCRKGRRSNYGSRAPRGPVGPTRPSVSTSTPVRARPRNRGSQGVSMTIEVRSRAHAASEIRPPRADGIVDESFTESSSCENLVLEWVCPRSRDGCGSRPMRRPRPVVGAVGMCGANTAAAALLASASPGFGESARRDVEHYPLLRHARRGPHRQESAAHRRVTHREPPARALTARPRGRRAGRGLAPWWSAECAHRGRSCD